MRFFGTAKFDNRIPEKPRQSEPTLAHHHVAYFRQVHVEAPEPTNEADLRSTGLLSKTSDGQHENGVDEVSTRIKAMTTGLQVAF